MKNCEENIKHNNRAQTKASLAKITPECALEMLKRGNKRFLKNPVDRNLKRQVQVTSKGQFPYAAVLSCLDSRVPTELIFDQGIGDIFNARVAGNFVNDDILGSLEFACTRATAEGEPIGAKLILVLGHTDCGAIEAAISVCEHGSAGLPCNLGGMVNRLSDKLFQGPTGHRQCETDLNKLTKRNVIHAMEDLRNSSTALRELEKKGEIIIRGGIYNMSSGKVKFLKADAHSKPCGC